MTLDVNLAKNQLPRKFSSEPKLTTLAQKASIHAMYVVGTINGTACFSLPVVCFSANSSIPTRE